MQLDDATDAYLVFLRVERGLSDATLRAYGNDLRGFAAYLEGKRANWASGAQGAIDYLAALTKPPPQRRAARPNCPPRLLGRHGHRR